MLCARIIPCLLVKKGGLVKTVQFSRPKYVGDPINAVRIFNEKEVDELIVLDIDATTLRKEPDYVMIRKLAAECRMPLCYGGGVTSVEQAEKIIGMGVEKVAISAAAINNPSLITSLAKLVGTQSVVVVIDAKSSNIAGGYEVYTHNASQKTGKTPSEVARRAQELGAGEVVINSVDSDGMMQGYDFKLVSQIRESISLPMTALGGAGALKDIRTLIDRFGIVGAAAGSLFVFKGIYKAVLINYPNRTEKEALFVS